jgi:anti-sigma regulatory factor (Ser/Thr protein kinase)
MGGADDGLIGVVRLAFPPEPRLLGTVRLVVGIVARKAGIDEEAIEDLKVAASETCAVAIGDLARSASVTPIELDLIERKDGFGVEVRDRAPEVARWERASPEVDTEVDDRQLGMALIGALVDDLHSEELLGGGHRTSFWVRRPPEAQPARG